MGPSLRLNRDLLGILCMLGGALMLLQASSLYADENTLHALVQPGFTHATELSNDTTSLAGVELDSAPPTYSSPLIANIDGDASNGNEIALASADGTISVITSLGTTLWSAKTPNVNCTKLESSNRVHSSIAAGDLLGNGQISLVIGYGGVGTSACGGGVAAYDGTTGAQLWDFDLVKFAKKEKFSERFHTVFSTPALADVDGDGKMEIAFGSFDRHIYLLEATGKPRWYYQAADTVWSSPAFGDIDGDGKLEVIAGTDISANKKLVPPTKNGGILYALKSDKRKKLLATFRDKTLVKWSRPFDQVLFSSPVVADLLPSNAGQEVVIGSGTFFPQNSSAKKGRWLKIVSLKTGKLLRTLNSPTCIASSPAVADIDGDGALEVVATVSGDSSIGGDGIGRIIAWKPTASEPFWQSTPSDRGKNDEQLGFFASPVIADLDGNGSLEVIALNGGGVSIVAGATGAQLSCAVRGCETTPLFQIGQTVRTTPAVGDLDNDGDLELVVSASHSGRTSRGFIYAWSNLAGLLNSSASSATPYAAPWPMARGSASRKGR